MLCRNILLTRSDIIVRYITTNLSAVNVQRGPKSKPLSNYQKILLNRNKACQSD